MNRLPVGLVGGRALQTWLPSFNPPEAAEKHFGLAPGWVSPAVASVLAGSSPSGHKEAGVRHLGHLALRKVTCQFFKNSTGGGGEVAIVFVLVPAFPCPTPSLKRPLPSCSPPPSGWLSVTPPGALPWEQ